MQNCPRQRQNLAELQASIPARKSHYGGAWRVVVLAASWLRALLSRLLKKSSQTPSDIELYKSLIGPDGWCIHYEKSTRKCSIYPDRPYFCRVEPDIFESLYGITKKKFNKVACGSCRDTIKEIYGSHSMELDNFNRSLRSSD
ncbi:hypothetical protein OIU78_002254 [Salix suchowensis]|nr:hypothetical protein OIU78_002254 [Salix suchowensis]